MLKRKNRLIKNKDFKEVLKKGYFFREQYLAMKSLKTDFADTKIGFIVSKKFSKRAVMRNKAKRILSEILRLKIDNIKTGFDIVVIPSQEILNNNFQNIKQAVDNLFIKSKLLK